MIVIVNPNNRLSTPFTAVEPPLWAGLIASYRRNLEEDVSILDAEAMNWTVDRTAEEVTNLNPDKIIIVVMGINPSASSTPKMPVTKSLIEKLSGQNISVAGLHPSALPDETKAELGVEVIDKPFEDMPSVAWDLLPMDRYRAHNWHCLDGSLRSPYGVIYTSLGCPFKCSYCNIHALYGENKIQYRNPQDVINEIDILVNKYGVHNIKFWDEMFAFNKHHVITICDLIIQRGYDLNIWAYGRVDTVDIQMLKKMKRAGINWIGYGIESADENIREGVAKKFAQAKITKAIEMTHDAGININGNFIFGLPEDDMNSMQETLEFAKSLLLEYVNFYVAMPYPGSELYLEAKRQGLKLPKSWTDYGQYSKDTQPLPTKYLSAKAILEFRDFAFKDYFTNPKYLKMIRGKFGQQAVEHIQEMLTQKIRGAN